MKKKPTKTNQDKWFLSSTGNGDISLTIKGILMSVIPLVITIARLKGSEVQESDLVEVVQLITAMVASMTVAYGLGRKIIIAVADAFDKMN